MSAAVLGLAVAAGLRSSPTSLGPLIAAESLSARASGALLLLGTKIPLGYALVAGMLASVNPCGFALLRAVTCSAFFLEVNAVWVVSATSASEAQQPGWSSQMAAATASLSAESAT